MLPVSVKKAYHKTMIELFKSVECYTTYKIRIGMSRFEIHRSSDIVILYHWFYRTRKRKYQIASVISYEAGAPKLIMIQSRVEYNQNVKCFYPEKMHVMFSRLVMIIDDIKSDQITPLYR